MGEMSSLNHFEEKNQTYFAGQWVGAGVYRCLDPCPLAEKIVVLTQDGLLPDPTHGWVARFRRVRGREAEHFLAKALQSGTNLGSGSNTEKSSLGKR
jgi:hypothetical protein